MSPPPPELLPPGVRSRFVDGVNGLRIHLLEAGHAPPGRPVVLLLHGFPELAFSWRHVMGPLAEAGYHVIAPDQRGYGATTGWDASYDGDLGAFRLFNLVRDMMGLLAALGHRSVAAVVGHDFGSPVAAWCALLRPDVFRAVALMSAPFAGPPALPEGVAPAAPAESIHDALARLKRPRKHYQWYYSTPRGERRHDRLPAGRARLPARLLPHEKRRLARQPPGTAFRLDRAGAGPAAHLLRDGPRPHHGRNGRAGDARPRRRRRLPLAAGGRTAGLQRRAIGAPASRAGCNGIAAGPKGSASPSSRSSPAG